MNIESIINLIDSNPIENKKYQHLLNAINDWPNEVENISEYFNEVKNFLNINSIELGKVISANKKNVFDEKNAWKHESVSELILFLKEK